MNITILEFKVMRNIAENYLTPHNGAVPPDHWGTHTYASEVFEGSGPCREVKNEEARGAFSSLVKKGLAFHQKDPEGDAAGLTEEGYKIYIKLMRKFGKI